MLTRVKVCGLCSAVDAKEAADAGAEYVGVILKAQSPRLQTIEQAKRICDAAAGAQRVGVFVDATEGEMHDAVARLGLDVIQLHGGESTTLVERLRESCGVSVWKALRPQSSVELERACEAWFGRVDGLLLDGWSPARHGGTGTRFDWSMAVTIRDHLPEAMRFIVAGGLDAGNVADAIDALRPDVVDVSSGVESTLCVKSADRMRAFLHAVRSSPADAGVWSSTVERKP